MLRGSLTLQKSGHNDNVKLWIHCLKFYINYNSRIAVKLTMVMDLWIVTMVFQDRKCFRENFEYF